jgi:hypothetical protein
MPIINENPANPPQEPVNPNIKPREYRGITNDTKYSPLRALKTHISGFPWEVEYFSQYLNADNAVAAQNINREAVYQQYARIKRMEIMVQSGISASQDSQSREMSARGSAVTYPGIIPNEGDMFVADLWGGRRAVYTITNIEQLSIMTDTCYSFDYQIVDYDSQIRYADLVSKISKDYVFVRDFIYTNQRPYLVETEYEFLQIGEQFLMDSQARFLKDFVNQQFKTFLVPDQNYFVYDLYHAEAVLKLIDGTQNPDKALVRLQNCDTGYPYTIETMWDGLLSLNGANRDTWATRLGIIETSSFNHQPLYASIRWSGIDAVYHALGNSEFAGTLPADFYLLDFGSGEQLRPGTIRPLYQKLPVNQVILRPVLGGLDTEDIEPPLPSPVLSYPVSTDDCYVFTEAFYDNTTNQSVLEIQTNRALAGVTLSRASLLELIKASYRWTMLDRFYYLPVLWVLVRTSLSEM